MQLNAYIALGWTPILAVATTNGSAIQQVVGWIGGNGTAPVTGQYVGSNGFVTNITNGVNIAGGAGGGSLNVSAGTTSNNLANIVFSNSNGLSFGLNGSTITGSYTQSPQTNFVFSNSNGISFGTNGSTVTATVATNYQSQGAYLTTAMLSNAGSNFIGTSQSSLFQQTSQMSNYQTTGNYLTTAMQSNAGSNFLGTNSALTANGVSVTANSSGLSLNFPAFLTTAQSPGAYLTTAMQSGSQSQLWIMGNSSATIGGTNISGTMYSNGMSLSAAAPGGGGNTMTVSAANGSFSSNAITFANSNGVSFSTGTQGIYATVATNYQSQGAYLTTAMQSNAATISNINLSAGTTSNNLSAITFTNANGVSWQLNGSVMSASVQTNYQSTGNYLTTAMQSNAATISNINVSAGTTSNNLSAITFSNSNGISFGMNGSVITGTVATNYQSQGAYLTTAMQSNAATISNINVSAGTTSNNLSAVTFSNANGVTFGMNGSVVTASVAAAGGAQTGISGISGGTTQMTSGTAVFSNSNGVSFGVNGNTITATVATNYQSQGAYLTTAMQSNAATISNINVSAGTTSNNLSAITFSNSNGITFGLNGSVITGTVATNYQSQGAYLTTAMASNAGSNFLGTNSALTANGVSVTANSSGLSLNFPAFLTTAQPVGAYLTTAMASNAGSNFMGTNTALTANGVSVTANSSGLSLNFPAFLTTAQPVGAYLTTAMASNASTNFAGLGTTFNGANISGSMTVNTAGVNLSLSAAAPGGGGGAAISAVGNSQNTGTVSFANGGGVSFGLSNNGVMTATVATNYQSQGAYLTTAMQSNAGSNFLGTNSALTANGVSVTANSSGLSLNFPAFLTTAMASNASTNFAGLGTTFNGANISGSMTVNTAGINLSMSVAAPGGAAINVSAGSTSNNLQTIVFSNSNGFSFGLNGSTVTGSWQGSPKSFFAFPIGGIMTSNTSTLGASSVFVQPFILPYDVSASYIRMPASFAYGSTTAATTANTTLGISQTQTIWVNIYSNGTGANSKSLQYITQGSLVMAQQVNASVGAASNNQTVGHTITYGAIGNTSSFSTTYNVNAASIQISTTHLTSFNALRWLDIPMPMSLSGGAYWMGIQRSSGSATAGSNIMTNVTSNMSQYIVTQVNTNWAVMGGASNNSTDGINIGQGLWSTNSSGATSSSMGFASISTQASQPLMPFQFIRQS